MMKKTMSKLLRPVKGKMFWNNITFTAYSKKINYFWTSFFNKEFNNAQVNKCFQMNISNKYLSTKEAIKLKT